MARALELFPSLTGEFPFVLQHRGVAEEFAELARFISDALSAVDAVLAERKVLQRPDLVKVILDFLHDSGGAIFAEVVHAVEGLEDAAPFFGLGLDFGPEVLHDDVVVFPVVRVVSQHLQLTV